MIPDSSMLADRIAAYCIKAGIKPSSFGQKHFKNPRLHERLKSGGTVTMATYQRLTAILDAPVPERRAGAAAGTLNEAGGAA